MVKIDIKKRYVYFLIGLFVIVGLGFVLAQTIPNPGHGWGQIEGLPDPATICTNALSGDGNCIDSSGHNNGSNCGPGEAARGVDADGNAEDCFTPTTGEDDYVGDTGNHVTGGNLNVDGALSIEDKTPSAAWGGALYLENLNGNYAEIQMENDAAGTPVWRFRFSHGLEVHGDIEVTGVVGSSDRRFKKNIVPLESSLDNVLKLQGVSYDWNLEKFPENGFREGGQIGLIAQDLEKVYPDLVSENGDGYKSVAYGKIAPILIEAIKELKAQNDALKEIVCKNNPEEIICLE